jgi:hypothetical protein
MPSNEGDYGGKPAKNRMSKNVAQPLTRSPHPGPRQKRGWRFTDELLR